MLNRNTKKEIMYEKNEISGLDKNLSARFQFGLIFGLLTVLFLLNMGFKKVVSDYDHEMTISPEDIIEVVEMPKAPLPPTPPKTTKRVIIETVKVIPPKPVIKKIIPDPKPVKVTANTKVTIKPTPTKPVVKKKVEKKETPKPPKVEKPDNKIYNFVSEKPRFPSTECETTQELKVKQKCAETAMIKFLSKSLRYPSIAKENGIEGIAVIEFVVNKKGEIVNPKILRDPGGGCGKEALRMVKKMPIWIPGKHNGQKVKALFRLPIKFELRI